MRRGQHDRARARRDCLLDLADVELELALGAERDVHRRRAGSREDPRIGGVERLRDDDLVALAEHEVQTENIAACAPGKKTTRLGSTDRPAQADVRFAISWRSVASPWEYA